MIKNKIYRNGNPTTKKLILHLKKLTKSLQSLSLLRLLSCRQIKIFLKFFFFNLKIITFFSSHDPEIRGAIKNSTPRSFHYKRHWWLKNPKRLKKLKCRSPRMLLDRQSSQSSGKGLHHRLVLPQEPSLLKNKRIQQQTHKEGFFPAFGTIRDQFPLENPLLFP